MTAADRQVSVFKGYAACGKVTGKFAVVQYGIMGEPLQRISHTDDLSLAYCWPSPPEAKTTLREYADDYHIVPVSATYKMGDPVK